MCLFIEQPSYYHKFRNSSNESISHFNSGFYKIAASEKDGKTKAED